jgi:uncharacterized protein YkwD
MVMTSINPRIRLAAAALVVAATACGSDLLGVKEIDDLDVQLFASAVNQHRVSVGCPELDWNGDVGAVAQAHSEDMVARDYFDHVNPDGDSPFDRLRDAGISYSAAAENIAYGYSSADAVLAGWLASPGHRANIENCSLTEHGVGLRDSYWTHVFIRP